MLDLNSNTVEPVASDLGLHCLPMSFLWDTRLRWVNIMPSRQPFRFLFYFTAAGVKCRVAAVQRLPVLHHSADYILITFGIIEPILLTLKIEYRLICALGRMQPCRIHCCI